MVTKLLDQSFFFLRHGQTGANALDVISGSTDDPLDAVGLAQAEAAAEVLKDQPIASIWHSPLARAKATAQAVALRKGLPLNALPDLSERNWGVWEGQSRSILVREQKPEGGEGPEEFAARVARALDQITGPFPALIVAHSGTGRVLQQMLTDREVERPQNAQPVLWEKDENGHWTMIKLSQDL